MCLRNPRKVELNEPITTYKVLEVEDGPFGPIYHSPYNKYMEHSTWNVGETNEISEYKGFIDVWTPEFGVPVIGDGVYTPIRIEWGALHSYASLDGARKRLLWFTDMERFPFRKYVIGECQIPEDSAYVYSGNDNKDDGECSYASQKLMLLNIIEDGEEES